MTLHGSLLHSLVVASILALASGCSAAVDDASGAVEEEIRSGFRTIRCTTRDVVEGAFEGDLSDDEAVSIQKQRGKWRVTIGSYGYTDGEESVTVTRDDGETTAVLQGAEEEYTIRVNGSTGMIHSNDGEKVADLHRCR